MTDVNLTQGEVAQLHRRLYKIQLAAKASRLKDVYNQARLLLLLVVKAERRQELKHRKSKRNKMNTYNIEPNHANGGLCCFFGHNGKEYCADLCLIPFSDYGTECMIFAAEDGQVTSFSEVYCKRGIPVSREALVECIEDFKKQGNEKDNVQ